MSIQITENLKNALKNPLVETAMAVKIDGYDNYLGNVALERPIRIGDDGLLVGDDWRIGGSVPIEDQLSYLQMQGTTTKITQKTDPSKGIGSSITQMSIALIDFNEAMTYLVSPSKVVADVIGRRVTVFTGAKDTFFPQDYIPIFRGVIINVRAGANTIVLDLSSTDEKKRVAVQPAVTSKLANPFDFRSATYQDMLYWNREDVANVITVTYSGGGTAGSEAVSLLSTYSIQVQIENGVSTAAQIKKAIENSNLSNQLVECKITGTSSTPQTTGSFTLNTDTSVDLESASEFLTPVDSMETYAVIENELIKYTGKSTNSLTGVSRQQNSSRAQYQPTEKDIKQVLYFKDHGINIALKLMLSGAPTYYVENVKVDKVEQYNLSTTIANAFFFEGIDIEQDYGVTINDLVTSTGSSIAGNNVTDDEVLEVGKTDTGSYIVVPTDLTIEVPTALYVKLKCKYNVYPIGLGMLPSEVDIAQHENIRDSFLPIFPLEIPVTEITNAKDFLDREVYLQMSCLSIPRKGRSSLVYTIAPLPTEDVVVLDLTNVENPADLIVQRSLNENFINQVQFDYDYDPVTETYLTHKNYPEEVDRSQIDVGAKPFVLQSKGLISSQAAAATTEQSAEKYLSRYANAAEFIKGIKVAFSAGYPMEIGDLLGVDYTALKLSDFDSGTREGVIKLMEVVNKTFDQRTKSIVIDIVNTSFGFGDRYGVISPASLVDSGSTTTKIKMQKSWSTLPYQLESAKWASYLGQKINVRTEDFSTVYETYIRGFDNLTPQGMLVDALPAPPAQGWIIECPPYPDDVDQTVLQFWKIRHAFASPTLVVASGASTTEFDVSPSDIGKFFIGGFIRLHNYAFTQDSKDVKIIEITGNTIKVNKSLGFIPDTTHFIDLIGFPDLQQAYRVV